MARKLGTVSFRQMVVDQIFTLVIRSGSLCSRPPRRVKPQGPPPLSAASTSLHPTSLGSADIGPPRSAKPVARCLKSDLGQTTTSMVLNSFTSSKSHTLTTKYGRLWHSIRLLVTPVGYVFWRIINIFLKLVAYT